MATLRTQLGECLSNGLSFGRQNGMSFSLKKGKVPTVLNDRDGMTLKEESSECVFIDRRYCRNGQYQNFANPFDVRQGNAADMSHQIELMRKMPSLRTLPASHLDQLLEEDNLLKTYRIGHKSNTAVCSMFDGKGHIIFPSGEGLSRLHVMDADDKRIIQKVELGFEILQIEQRDMSARNGSWLLGTLLQNDSVVFMTRAEEKESFSLKHLDCYSCDGIPIHMSINPIIKFQAAILCQDASIRIWDVNDNNNSKYREISQVPQSYYRKSFTYPESNMTSLKSSDALFQDSTTSSIRIPKLEKFGPDRINQRDEFQYLLHARIAFGRKMYQHGTCPFYATCMRYKIQDTADREELRRRYGKFQYYMQESKKRYMNSSKMKSLSQGSYHYKDLQSLGKNAEIVNGKKVCPFCRDKIQESKFKGHINGECVLAARDVRYGRMGAKFERYKGFSARAFSKFQDEIVNGLGPGVGYFGGQFGKDGTIPWGNLDFALHPKVVMSMCPDGVFSVDLRVRQRQRRNSVGSPESYQLSPDISPEESFESIQKFFAMKVNPWRRRELAVVSTNHLSIYDQRNFKRPILRWRHYSDYRPSTIIHFAKHANQRGESILLRCLKRNGFISFRYSDGIARDAPQLLSCRCCTQDSFGLGTAHGITSLQADDQKPALVRHFVCCHGALVTKTFTFSPYSRKDNACPSVLPTFPDSEKEIKTCVPSNDTMIPNDMSTTMELKNSHAEEKDIVIEPMSGPIDEIGTSHNFDESNGSNECPQNTITNSNSLKRRRLNHTTRNNVKYELLKDRSMLVYRDATEYRKDLFRNPLHLSHPIDAEDRKLTNTNTDIFEHDEVVPKDPVYLGRWLIFKAGHTFTLKFGRKKRMKLITGFKTTEDAKRAHDIARILSGDYHDLLLEESKKLVERDIETIREEVMRSIEDEKFIRKFFKNPANTYELCEHLEDAITRRIRVGKWICVATKQAFETRDEMLDYITMNKERCLNLYSENLGKKTCPLCPDEVFDSFIDLAMHFNTSHASFLKRRKVHIPMRVVLPQISNKLHSYCVGSPIRAPILKSVKCPFTDDVEKYGNEIFLYVAQYDRLEQQKDYLISCTPSQNTESSQKISNDLDDVLLQEMGMAPKESKSLGPAPEEDSEFFHDVQKQAMVTLGLADSEGANSTL